MLAVKRIVTRSTTLMLSKREAISTNASSLMMATLVQTMNLVTVLTAVNFRKSARVRMIKLSILRNSSHNS